MIPRDWGWWRLPAMLSAMALIWTVTSIPASADSQHVIQPGETLSGIAEAYGVPLDALAAQNHIVNVNLIFAGEQLTLPGQPPPVGPPAPGSGSHTVQNGETLTSIATMKRTTVAQLIAANPDIVDPNRIYVGQSLVVPGGAAKATPPAVSAATVQNLLVEYAHQYGLDPALVEALAWQESGWRQDVVSATGALGVMQLMPDTTDWLASEVISRPLDVSGNVTDNVEAGVAFLRFLIDRTGTVQLGIAAYYQGPGSLKRDGVLPETQQYVDNVMAIRSYLMVYGEPPV